ncbi:uncharacterized protein PpBr36_06630 [Pyricularia pennisetigena]|uniref:uncharacterized protein n=1 Tax=Pyricularia pennisetigena TaxID=1578925 RepID=UPI001151DEA9|nr:uncharacterized protein PpBr36_06630 [Pyricularia pennisetigena]TLS23115.1 hypothetical protein PpBr36_06630 [Pyricularia pennisetigena]
MRRLRGLPRRLVTSCALSSRTARRAGAEPVPISSGAAPRSPRHRRLLRRQVVVVAVGRVQREAPGADGPLHDRRELVALVLRRVKVHGEGLDARHVDELAPPHPGRVADLRRHPARTTGGAVV